MKRVFKSILFTKLRKTAVFSAALMIILFQHNVSAFALLGPYADWMTPTNNFQIWGDIGGPMAISEGYRWNVPVVTYGFDQSFVDAFGSNGVAAVESAIAILNNLPPASQLDPTTFPCGATKVNFIAASQSLVYLKSTTLFLLLEHLGLAQPTRSAFSIHDVSISGGAITTNILDLNFDPFSLAPSDSVNGVAYFCEVSIGTNSSGGLIGYAYPFPVDPQNPFITAVADEGSTVIPELPTGSFFTGLTQDDAGGLRYLLSTNNYKFETLLPGVHGTGTNAGNYVNLALRAGVDKITFVRQDYDTITGDAYVPLTNFYTDNYLTNDIVVSQQLQRVISKPDFIFTAFPGFDTPWGIKRTGTTNWINNGAINGSSDLAGPGTIVPQINISFEEYGLWESVTTGDAPPYIPPIQSTIRWGSFDGSTNAPVVFPDESAVGAIDSLQVQLLLQDPSTDAGAVFYLEPPVKFGDAATLQTSSNLINWVSQATVTNFGLQVNWSHNCSLPRGFFRVVPAQ